MRTFYLSILLAACGGHGETPTAGTITIRGNSCDRDADVIQFETAVEVGLDVQQAIRISFLPDLDGLQLSRTRTWDCGEWSPVDFDRGCGRLEADQPIRQLISVIEVNTLQIGTIPPRFAYTMVSSITDIVAPDEIDSTFVTEQCD